LEGHPAAAYQIESHAGVEQELFPSGRFGYFAFFYPPPFLLLCMPLAALSYLPALIAWLGVTFAPFLLSVRRVLGQRWALLPAAAIPAGLVNIEHGQNGFLTGACLGWTMLLLERRPFIAGASLGLLIFKPHFLIAAPFLLLPARRWMVVAGAAASALGLMAASYLAFGADVWLGFLKVSPVARVTLEQGLVEPGKMQSVFAAAHLVHASTGMAYAAQLVVSGTVCAVLAAVGSRRPGGYGEGALLISATVLCTPFLLDYDLVCLALPIAWVTAEAQRTGWLRWEKSVLLAAYLLPLVSRPLGLYAGLPVAPLVLAGLFLMVARRAIEPSNGNCRRVTAM
jgi:hypothetical protein